MDLGQWVAEIALDGIVAGIVGGAVTGLAVWWTITHERKLRVDEDHDQRLEDLRLAVADLLQLSADLVIAAHRWTGATPLRPAVVRAIATLAVAESRARRAHDPLQEPIRRIALRLSEIVHPDAVVSAPDVIATANQLEGICRAWLSQDV